MKAVRRLGFLSFGLLLATALLTGAQAAEIQIHVLHQDFANALDEIAKRYERDNPGNTVVVEVQSGEYWDKITTMAAGGSLPDVFWIGDGQIDTWANSGFIADVGAILEREGVALDVIPIIKEIASVDGKLYFMPIEWGTWALAYHRQLFDEAGLAYPDGNWNWTEFAETARLLTRTNGDTASVQGTGSMWIGWWGSWVQLVWQAGGALVSEDGKTALPDLEAVTRAFDFARALTHDYNATPAVPNASFIQGTRAMEWVLPGTMFNFAANMEPDSWGLTAFPRGDGPNGRHAAQTYTTGLAISASSTLKSEVAKFFQYVHSPEGQQIIFRMGRGLPPTESVLKNWFFDPATMAENKLPETFPALFDIVDNHSHPLPALPDFERFMNSVNPHFQAVINQEVAPRVGATQAQAAAQATL